MKTVGRFLGLVLALALLLTCLPLPARADQIIGSGSCGDSVSWTLTADGLLTISGQGAMENYPEEYPGWDGYADSLDRVVIEEGITHIGDYAFWGYDRIRAVELPESLRTIGGVAFGYCAGLRQITIPAGVTLIRDYAFAKCSGLERIDFAGSAPAFGGDVFLEVDAMASHPAGDSSWDGVESEGFGGMLSWLVEGTPDSLELLYAPTVTSCAVGDAVDLRGIWVEACYADGTTVLLKSGAMTLEVADTSTAGIHTATASYQGLTVEFPIYVHARRSTETVDPALWPESPHDYGSNMDDTRTISHNGAESLTLTFSEQTYLETGYDFLYLLDPADNVYAKFTGAEAAGITVTIPADVVRIRLVSDHSYNDYGYSLTAVTAEVLEHTGQPVDAVAATCITDGCSGGLLCDICGRTVGGQLIPALGHSWGDWGEMDGGSLYRVCGVCGDYDYRFVDRVFTDAGDSEYGELTLAEIRAMYEAIDWQMASGYETAPITQAPYAIGRLTDACLDNLTAQLNFFRRLAKLDSVRWDEELVEYAQAAALVNAANDTLSHYPGAPDDMAEAIYQKGAVGAASANLAWGTNMGMMDSVPGYLDDSDSSNIDAVGHRRWVLNPDMGLVGFGTADAGARSHYHAMYAHDNSNNGYSNADFVAYPGGNGIYPSELFESHVAWSVQLDADVFRQPDAGEVQVTLTREQDGRTWTFSSQAQDTAAGYFNVNNVGYGGGYAVIFRPNGAGEYEGVYTVLITGLRTRSGETAAVSYSVDFRSLAQTQTVPGDVDADGAVDSDDAIHLLYHTLFGAELYPVSGGCDFNGDGAVNSDDAIHLLYHTLFGGELYPLHG